MPRKTDGKQLQQMLKRRGAAQAPVASENVTEIRSCGVMVDENDTPPDPNKLLGGVVIIWEYAVAFSRVQQFHKDLKDAIEPPLFAMATGDARYYGTYMLHAGGTPRYRTIWGYTSLAHMNAFWAAAPGAATEAAMRLREYWLRDPNRDEARWLPAARNMFGGDTAAFASLTLARVAAKKIEV